MLVPNDVGCLQGLGHLATVDKASSDRRTSAVTRPMRDRNRTSAPDVGAASDRPRSPGESGTTATGLRPFVTATTGLAHAAADTPTDALLAGSATSRPDAGSLRRMVTLPQPEPGRDLVNHAAHRRSVFHFHAVTDATQAQAVHACFVSFFRRPQCCESESLEFCCPPRSSPRSLKPSALQRSSHAWPQPDPGNEYSSAP